MRNKKIDSDRVYNIRDVACIRDMVETNAEIYADRPAFLWKQKDGIKSVCYREVYDDVKRFATELLARGYGDKKIAVIGENCYAWALTYLTVTSAVGVIMPIDRDYQSSQLEFVMADAEADILFYSDKHEKIVKGANLTVPAVPFSALCEWIEAGGEKIREGSTLYEDHILNPMAFGILLYTSGTMGVSKGVMLTQYNVCSNVLQALRNIKVYPTDRALSVLPLHHTYECTAGFLAFFYAGASVAYNQSLVTLPADMKDFKPTVMVVVPLILHSFYKKIRQQYEKIKGGKLVYRLQSAIASLSSVKRKKAVFGRLTEMFGGNIRAFLVGAAALSEEAFHAFRKFGYTVYIGYGLTETSPVIAMHGDRYQSPRDVGFPLPGVQTKIKDPDENGIGELVVKGNNVMLGYYKRPEATAEVLDRGWFSTGDLARINPNGSISVFGRTKSMIVAENGKKILPEELEICIENKGLTEDSFVFYDEGEEKIVASVVPNETLQSSEDGGREELTRAIREINDTFPAYKRIGCLVIRKAPFEKTTTHKIKRNDKSNREVTEPIRI